MVTQPSQELIPLSAGPLELMLCPSVGGSIARFDWVVDGVRTPIMRGCDGIPQNVLAAASFPLVPFVNRIRGGRFDFRGREVRLAPNMAGDSSPLHGQGWLLPWHVLSASTNAAELATDHAAGEWPWSYRSSQSFALDEHGLTINLRCRNLSADPMPCGLGQHSYFRCGPETRIDTSVSHVWTIDNHILAVERIPAEGRYDLSTRLVCGQGLDHGFGGWGGLARISDPNWQFGLEISSPTARFFQLYSPSESNLFVAEPVTHANDALSASESEWRHLGMQILEPGEEFSLAMRIAVAARVRR